MAIRPIFDTVDGYSVRRKYYKKGLFYRIECKTKNHTRRYMTYRGLMKAYLYNRTGEDIIGI